jgi:hypothetical protein
VVAAGLLAAVLVGVEERVLVAALLLATAVVATV